MIAAIYATNSKTLRRVIVSDADVAPGIAQGESFLEIPLEAYANLSDVRAYVAQAVGPALHSGRCIEVDGFGLVLNCLAADPDIDAPQRGGVLQIHDSADVGDINLGGQFVSMKPVFVPNKERIVSDLTTKADPVPLPEAQVFADQAVAEANALIQKQQQAALQAHVVAPTPKIEPPSVAAPKL